MREFKKLLWLGCVAMAIALAVGEPLRHFNRECFIGFKPVIFCVVFLIGVWIILRREAKRFAHLSTTAATSKKEASAEIVRLQAEQARLTDERLIYEEVIERLVCEAIELEGFRHAVKSEIESVDDSSETETDRILIIRRVIKTNVWALSKLEETNRDLRVLRNVLFMTADQLSEVVKKLWDDREHELDAPTADNIRKRLEICALRAMHGLDRNEQGAVLHAHWVDPAFVRKALEKANLNPQSQLAKELFQLARSLDPPAPPRYRYRLYRFRQH